MLLSAFQLIWCASQLTSLAYCALSPIFYFLIYRIFKRSRRRIADISTTTRSSKREMKQKHRLVKRVLWLIGAYFVCSFPIFIIFILYSSGLVQHLAFFHIPSIIFVGNSCINPVIYVLRDKQFRDAARKLFKLWKASSNFQILPTFFFRWNI